MTDNKLHVAMYPWFAIGHLTSFLQLSNKLAEKGHRISFFLPTKTQPILESQNLHPNLITFIPIDVPHVDGLPQGTATTSDIANCFHSQLLLMTAMDLTQPFIEESLTKLKTHFVFFDFAYWVPAVTRRLGMKSIHYCTISPATVGYLIRPKREYDENPKSMAELMNPPPGFPPSSIKLYTHEARALMGGPGKSDESSDNISFPKRMHISLTDPDAIAFRSIREMEGIYCDFLETQLGEPVILTGQVVPELQSSKLDEKWRKFLDRFEPKTVIFCAFGSECRLSLVKFQELLLGFEMTGLPFLVALKPPEGTETIESALPEGFTERTHERGIVYGGWVQQPLILRHPSVGCFVTHCGSGSLSEAMVSECQLVLIPNCGDQIINARLMGGDHKVGVEVEKGDEDGLYTKESVCKAVKAVMEDESEIGKEVRANRAKWREFLLSPGLADSYIDGFIGKLHSLLN